MLQLKIREKGHGLAKAQYLLTKKEMFGNFLFSAHLFIRIHLT